MKQQVENLKMKTPFKIVDPLNNIVGNEDGITYEAAFDLPNDGTSLNQMVVHVWMESKEATVCDIALIGRTFKDTSLGTLRDVPVKNIANVLYGFASLKTVQYLEFK